MLNIINDTFSPKDSFNGAAVEGVGNITSKFTAGTLFQKVTDESGKEVLKKLSDNSVVFGGAVVALEKLCGVKANFKPSSKNKILGNVGKDADSTASTATISLFGVGTGGSGLDFSSVKAPDMKQRDIIDPIPFRYGTTLTGADSTKYFLKKEKSGQPGTYEWYGKEFDSAPTIKSAWKNSIGGGSGTEITSEIYNNPSTEGIETYAEFHFSLNQYDIKEYFQATSGMNHARYNTFGFYIGNKDGDEYDNVRLFSVVTFKNRDVDIESSSFVYRLYALI